MNISSPNYPEIPNPHIECEWIIRAPHGEAITITFLERFDLQPTRNCEKEGVELHDGNKRAAMATSRHCGDMLPSSNTTQGNTLTVRYYTDSAEPGNGFKARVEIGNQYLRKFEALAKENPCTARIRLITKFLDQWPGRR